MQDSVFGKGAVAVDVAKGNILDSADVEVRLEQFITPVPFAAWLNPRSS
jgi:hypothetical protein